MKIIADGEVILDTTDEPLFNSWCDHLRAKDVNIETEMTDENPEFFAIQSIVKKLRPEAVKQNYNKETY